MPYRVMGPTNGILPIPTGMVVGFVRDPKQFAYLNYVELVPAPDIVYEYYTLDPDEPARMVDLNQFAWAYDDYRPTGRGDQVAGQWTPGSIKRWDFPYTIGEATQRIWQKNGVNVKQTYDQIKAAQAGLHRASRIVAALNAATFPAANTTSLNTLLGTSGAGYDVASGLEVVPAGTANPNFNCIRRSFEAVVRRIHLCTNGVVKPGDICAVMSPKVAQRMATSGEIFELLKQTENSYKELIQVPGDWARTWHLPPMIAGIRMVVEDTVRVFINRKDDGTVADATQSAQRDYILNTDTVYFLSRPGGLDGGYGNRSFSTMQLYHFNGEARIEAFTEPKHELMEGHVVMEDDIQLPALLSGFKLTDVLTAAGEVSPFMLDQLSVEPTAADAKHADAKHADEATPKNPPHKGR